MSTEGVGGKKKKPKSCQHSLWTTPKQDAIRRISGKCGGKWTSFPLELFFLKSRKGGHLVVTARWFVLVLSYREDGFHNNFVDRTLDRTSCIVTNFEVCTNFEGCIVIVFKTKFQPSRRKQTWYLLFIFQICYDLTKMEITASFGWGNSISMF